jgi:beta-phosphoglucomutase-like phosphatase (HAD superfamily)
MMTDLTMSLAMFRHVGMLKFLVCMCASEDVKRSKPAPDIFLLAAQKLGVEPHLCVGYEDAVFGLEAIRSAGFLAAIDIRTLPGYPAMV